MLQAGWERLCGASRAARHGGSGAWGFMAASSL